MNHNPRLKHAIMEVVENQLRDNNPKKTKETFERLVAAGRDGKAAKERIASVLVEDMHDMLKSKKEFDKEKYAEKLK